MSENNKLRDENGSLVGGLVVFDYIAGIDDFEAGKPPPEVTSASYDLGRQRASEKRGIAQDVQRWLDRQEAETDARMKELCPPDIYAEYRAKIDAIRAKSRISARRSA